LNACTLVVEKALIKTNDGAAVVDRVGHPFADEGI
jgi:hypothetical protein